MFQQGNIAELIDELVTELKPLSNHLAVANWQYRQFRNLRDGLLPQHLLSLQDFAENYRCDYQDAIQSVHWDYAQVTVFPTVNYYRYEI